VLLVSDLWCYPSLQWPLGMVSHMFAFL
jgi:hypothetical protein